MPEVNNKLAGHAPATIVGGKRVPGPRNRTESTGSNSGSRKDSSIDSTGSEEKVEQSVQSSVNQAGSLIDGVSMRLEEAYPPEAVKKFHDKPVPTHAKIENYRQINHKQQASLFQPRKQVQ